MSVSCDAQFNSFYLNVIRSNIIENISNAFIVMSLDIFEAKKLHYKIYR